MVRNDYIVVCDPRTSDLRPGFFALYRTGDNYSGVAYNYPDFKAIEHHGLSSVKHRIGSEVHRLWCLLPGGQRVDVISDEPPCFSTLYVYDPEDD